MPEPDGQVDGPLAGVRVLEVGSFIAGPFCGMLLGDLGADVVKVEEPTRGDALRSNHPRIHGESAIFLQVNRNKRSVALDLKEPDGRRAFDELVETADVVVENMRPGAMERLGFVPEHLVERHPRLVYVSVSGWGRTGPYAQRPGLDIMAQGMSGIMSITGEPGGAPAKAGVPICDLSCALYAALATTAALRHRDRTGRGQLVEVSLFESGASLTPWELAGYGATDEVPGPLGSAHQNSAPYQALRSADGYFTLGASTDVLWRRASQVLGVEHLVDDDRFADGAVRWRHRDELAGLLEAVTVGRPTVEWVDRLNAAGVPAGSVQAYDEVVRDPHLTERGFIVEVDHPTAGIVQSLGSPMRFTRAPVRYRPSPRLGEHTAEVLGEVVGERRGDLI